jgi:murein DD-endopeptidase MepM/ murein hydrolase activator NlpD
MTNAVLTSTAPAGSGRTPAAGSVTRDATSNAPSNAQPPVTPMPQQWLPSRGRECGGKNVPRALRRFCAGPRRAPLPFGEADELAIKLGLGDKKTVSHVLLQPPKPEWVAAAAPDPIHASIAAREAQARADAGEPALVWPVADGKFWRGFGRERGKSPKAKAKSKAQGRRGRHHDGVDIGAPEGTPAYSVADGIVLYSDHGIRGYGNLLVTLHADGSVAFYAHCRALYVFPGQRIARGQVVGETDKTGYARGPHLHFEYRVGGRLRDPMRYFAPPRIPGSS